MYICICKAVSEKRMQRAVDAGDVLSLRDLTRELGIGTCCGKCVPAARMALNAALSRRTQDSLPIMADAGNPMMPMAANACAA